VNVPLVVMPVAACDRTAVLVFVIEAMTVPLGMFAPLVAILAFFT
jgi:hypothetical protein